MLSTDTPDHHGSHRDLLWSASDPSTQHGIDAIIVPTARRPAALEASADLAEALQCTLVTLHSKEWTSAAKAAQRLPRSVDLIAVDVPDPARLRLPNWQTSRQLAHTVFAPRTDLSAKRNLGLVLSRLLGWSRVLFLDDDITGLDPSDVREASGLLDTHNAVGLHVSGFPDNSVVCHAYRQAGGRQQSFIGGGALAVQVERSTSFFPGIYNDDWFFLLDGDKRLQPVAVTGQVTQQPYDPFRPERARAEEFGDVLAEGIYWLLDQNRSIIDADKAHWGRFLVRRRQFIGHVLDMVRQDQALHRDEKARRITALQASLGSLDLITPARCENYLRAWTADRQRWHRHLEKLPSQFIQQRPQDARRLLALAALSRPGFPRLKWQIGAQGGPSAIRIPRTRPPRPGRPRPRPHDQLTTVGGRRRPGP